mmetsp:Transcript_74673/g.192690  ORF Transcript_74673/g.192690 Transcript_74673/m.192690 type:complete len:292 (-) Transcript_74673:245-1120(-)
MSSHRADDDVLQPLDHARRDQGEVEGGVETAKVADLHHLDEALLGLAPVIQVPRAQLHEATPGAAEVLVRDTLELVQVKATGTLDPDGVALRALPCSNVDREDLRNLVHARDGLHRPWQVCHNTAEVVRAVLHTPLQHLAVGLRRLRHGAMTAVEAQQAALPDQVFPLRQQLQLGGQRVLQRLDCRALVGANEAELGVEVRAAGGRRCRDWRRHGPRRSGPRDRDDGLILLVSLAATEAAAALQPPGQAGCGRRSHLLGRGRRDVRMPGHVLLRLQALGKLDRLLLLGGPP